MPGDSLYVNTKAKQQNTFDAIIVGSGISGGWAANTVRAKSKDCTCSPCNKEMSQRLIAHDLRSDCATMRGKRNTCAIGILNLQGYPPIEKNNCKTFTLAKNTRRNERPRNFWPHGRKNFCPFGLLFGQATAKPSARLKNNYYPRAKK